MPQLRPAMEAVVVRYRAVQPAILETFVDRGQLRQLSETMLAQWQTHSGLKLDHQRPLALMNAPARLAHITAGDTITTRDP
jgi:hypothetical protein